MSTAVSTKSAGFALQPANMSEAMKMAEMLSQSQMVPKSYQQKPNDTLVAMMMGSELGLNPIQAIQNIAVINGKPAIYGDALLALVQNHPAFGGHEESFDESTMTATCTVWRKGEKRKHTVTFSQADAQMAQLWGKVGPWKQYPKRMLMWRARGYALRDKFADALGGLITVEEARDIPEERDMGPVDAVREVQEQRHYPDADFEQNFPKWLPHIQAGKLDVDTVLQNMATKGGASEAQKLKIEQAAATANGEAA